MGYTTTYKGALHIDPPIDDHRFLAAWRDAIGDSRGSASDFFADLPAGLTHFDWEPVVDDRPVGTVTISCIVGVAHNGAEKSYDAEAWLTWLARTHLKPRGSLLVGQIECVGEDADTWTLLADGEEVTRVETDHDPVERKIGLGDLPDLPDLSILVLTSPGDPTFYVGPVPKADVDTAVAHVINTLDQKTTAVVTVRAEHLVSLREFDIDWAGEEGA
jgi:hypothetical protein